MWLSRILKSITFFFWSYARILGTIDSKNTLDWLHKNYNVNLSYPYMSIDGSELSGSSDPVGDPNICCKPLQWVTTIEEGKKLIMWFLKCDFAIGSCVLSFDMWPDISISDQGSGIRFLKTFGAHWIGRNSENSDRYPVKIWMKFEQNWTKFLQTISIAVGLQSMHAAPAWNRQTAEADCGLLLDLRNGLKIWTGPKFLTGLVLSRTEPKWTNFDEIWSIRAESTM